MIKQLLALSLVFVSSSAFAASSGGTAGGGSDGCGLGWQVTQKRSLIATTTRGTTNAVVPPGFGMTSGTIGCDQHEFAVNDQKAIQFVASNYEPLMSEMAEGRGEYLQAFHQTMSCAPGTYGQFTTTLQKSFPTLSTNSGNVVNFYNGVKQELKKDAVLSQSCDVI
jgi:hypothetical protein